MRNLMNSVLISILLEKTDWSMGDLEEETWT